MTVVVDTAFVVALLDGDDAHHPAASRWMLAADEDLVTTPLTLAEMDHFAAREGGTAASLALWDEFDRGVYGVRWWADALTETIAIARRHPEVGLADASLVALAARLNTNRIATFDHRRFRNLTTVGGDPFVVLPADAP